MNYVKPYELCKTYLSYMQEQNVAADSDLSLARVLARDVQLGLGSRPKYLQPKYFYDEAGSRLFENICLQNEYYLTRTEAELLSRHCSELVADHNKQDRVNVIELGSGTSLKTRILFRSLLSEQHKKVCYLPIDISQTALLETVNMLSGDFPNLDVREIISDYGPGLETACRLLSTDGESAAGENRGKIILFLGSSIGNLNPVESVAFLRMIRRNMNPDDSLVIGFDLEKDAGILEGAYNDAAGVTTRFNLNILSRINREIGGHFDLSTFLHRAFYNNMQHRIEMHLVSEVEQTVRVDALKRHFEFYKGESIHTENSYKYSVRRIEKLAQQCGLHAKQHFTDTREWFDLCLLKPAN